MADTVTETAKSEAETTMTAAGWTRIGGAGLQAWGFDHNAEGAPGEFTLVTADGDADADPRAVIWTTGRYHIGTSGNGGAAIASVIAEPHHRTLSQTLAIVPSLKLVKAETAKADTPTVHRLAQSVVDGNNVEHQG